MPFSVVVPVRFSRVLYRAAGTFWEWWLISTLVVSTPSFLYRGGAITILSLFSPYGKCTPAMMKCLPRRSQESTCSCHGIVTVGLLRLALAVSVPITRVALMQSLFSPYLSRKNQSDSFLGSRAFHSLIPSIRFLLISSNGHANVSQ